MAQYLAPGVYVEEIPGPRTIQAVGTSTAAFVGPCRYGPTSGRPQLLTSYLEFARIFGDAVDLEFEDTGAVTNYLALGVKGFFDEGGTSLYVMRTFSFTGDGPEEDHASFELAGATPSDPGLTIRARFPGAAGRMRVVFTLKVGNNVLATTPAGVLLTRVHEYDLVWAEPDDTTPAFTAGAFVVRRDLATGALELAGDGAPDLTDVVAAYPLTLVVEAQKPTRNNQGLPALGPSVALGEFGFDPRAIGTGVSTVLAVNPPTRSQALSIPIAIEGIEGLGAAADDLPLTIAEALLGEDVLSSAPDPTAILADRQVMVMLDGGGDGNAPGVGDYEGDPLTFEDYQNVATDLVFNGMLGFEVVDDISIVAAPGASTGWLGVGGTADGRAQAAQAINGALATHCEKMLYRVASLDTPPGLLPGEALDFRNLRSSTHAAVYYPWITVSHPVDDGRLDVPPAAYMAGVWARTDNDRGVIKAPANEVIRSALDLETRVNKAQQALLNPEGVNCLRFFPGPGFLTYGARTISDDPEWKYLNIRRYFNYVEKSIDEGTQWAVFEINGPALWDGVRHTIEGFLLNEWRSGALLGGKPEEGFFVRCDASTMTSDDLDQGRLICVIGICAAKPAEFVIFRISQMTATTSA